MCLLWASTEGGSRFTDVMGHLFTFTRDYALTMARNAPLTLRSAKASVDQLQKPAEQRDLAMLEGLIADCFNSQDYQEGVRSFSEKRRPVFQGQ
jgi:enoyl-CoA hydratase/carnithine racemase